MVGNAQETYISLKLKKKNKNKKKQTNKLRSLLCHNFFTSLKKEIVDSFL